MPTDSAILVESSADSPVSAVSWAAILAGAVTAIATTIILTSLGASFGFATAPGAIGTVTAMTGVAMIVIQWLSSAMGGYLTGRLRTRWTGTHTHEVFFRDTAHGLLTWSLATVVVVGLATWGAAAATTGATRAAATTASAPLLPNFAYDADTIFRSTGVNPDATASARHEASGILAAAAVKGALAPADRDYLIESAVSRSGITPAAAQERVATVVARERADAQAATQALDKARKSAAAFALFTGLSMLVGAFIACVAAALGGQLRDQHP